MEPGKYKGKLIDYSLTESNGKPAIILKFMLENGNEVSHWMFLTEKAAPWTTKTLMLFGFDGNNLEKIAEGPESGLLDTTKTIEVVMQNEEWIDGKGEPRTSLKVKFINEVGGGEFKRLAKKQATEILKGVNLKAHVLEAKTGIGNGDENAF